MSEIILIYFNDDIVCLLNSKIMNKLNDL